MSSPRKRGCFSSPVDGVGASVSLPRASGGVSVFEPFFLLDHRSSPRKRGCFLHRCCCPSPVGVFPAQAGVFLAHNSGVHLAGCLPRASGGVSEMQVWPVRVIESSPRKRGCFRSADIRSATASVFPAQAGVFPVRTASARSTSSLPRASGGVSTIVKPMAFVSGSSPRKRGCF